MLQGYKRAIVLFAERLGWLNWTDQGIVRLAIGSAEVRSSAVRRRSSTYPRPRPRKNEASASEDNGGAADGASEKWEGSTHRKNWLSSENPCLKKAQPGPVFAEQPAAFIQWVQAELEWIDDGIVAGLDRDAIAQLGRNTQLWIEDGIIGPQSRASRAYLPDLLELWDMASAFERGEWETTAQEC
jgi:hypothetical protein